MTEALAPNSNTQPLAHTTNAPAFDPALTIVRMKEVAELTGLARATINKRLKEDPTFPRPVALSDSKSRGAPIGFVLAEVQGWIRKRIALRNEVAA